MNDAIYLHFQEPLQAFNINTLRQSSMIIQVDPAVGWNAKNI